MQFEQGRIYSIAQKKSDESLVKLCSEHLPVLDISIFDDVGFLINDVLK